jgi:hypothetical protein
MDVGGSDASRDPDSPVATSARYHIMTTIPLPEASPPPLAGLDYAPRNSRGTLSGDRSRRVVCVDACKRL